jgi:hypothetical protein
MQDLKIIGFNRDEVYDKNGRFPYNFDGYRLDKIKISTTIESYQDIDDLITFLKVHRPCFISSLNANEAYK